MRGHLLIDVASSEEFLQLAAMSINVADPTKAS